MDVLSLVRQLEVTQWERPLHPAPTGPILARYDLQTTPQPPGDFEAHSSGSTGIPVIVQRSNVSRLWWTATNIREALWFGRDWRLSLAMLRANVHEPSTQPNWGPGWDALGPTGPLHVHPVSGDLNAWLRLVEPDYLIVYPSILKTLDLDALPSLKGVRTTGETLDVAHPLVADTYSAEEVGTIAIQCPDGDGAYHVMENIVIEIVDDDNEPVASGRVLVTDLTSAVIRRYDIGDHAEWGECSCGRGLQTLGRILGRSRNMALMPDGNRAWPRVGSHEFRSVAPIRRYQGVQTGRTAIELRLIVARALNAHEEDAVRALVRKWMGYPFDVTLVYMDEFPPGKFEEFVCLVT